jgi:hypothetical protein
VTDRPVGQCLLGDTCRVSDRNCPADQSARSRCSRARSSGRSTSDRTSGTSTSDEVRTWLLVPRTTRLFSGVARTDTRTRRPGAGRPCGHARCEASETHRDGGTALNTSTHSSTIWKALPYHYLGDGWGTAVGHRHARFLPRLEPADQIGGVGQPRPAAGHGRPDWTCNPRSRSPGYGASLADRAATPARPARSRHGPAPETSPRSCSNRDTLPTIHFVVEVVRTWCAVRPRHLALLRGRR